MLVNFILLLETLQKAVPNLSWYVSLFCVDVVLMVGVLSLVKFIRPVKAKND